MSRKHLFIMAGCLATVSGMVVSAAHADPGIGGGAAGRISGVVNVHDQPVDGATIYLFDRRGRLVDQDRTTRRGEFRFRDLRPAKYVLVMKSPQGGARRDIEVRSGETTHVRIVM